MEHAAMQNQTTPVEATESEDVPSVVIEIGDAVDLTEGTSNRSGSEDKRYKYQ